MSTTIDSLQIEIQSSSTNASQGISALAKSLGELKTNGTINVAIKNLNNLRNALRLYNGVPSNASKISALASSMEKLKSVGSVGSIGNSLSKLSTALKSLGNVNMDAVGPQIRRIADAAAPLSTLKAGGLNTMVNALSKIGKVTQDLDDDKIAAFAERIEKLNTTLEPLSTKMTTIQAGFRSIHSNARSAGSSIRQMGEEVNGASVNMASFIYIIQEAVQWIQAAVEKFSQFIAEAIEWDGIAARFGRGFGAEAQEVYDWIVRLNEEMGINIQQFMQYSSIYATMLTGFGVHAEDATKMALGYTELTYDIWAGYNDVYKTFEEASEAVKSAIAGEVEPIRRAGFTIIESTLEQTAANHGLEISLANATEAEKSYLRYLTLVDQAHAQSLVGTYAKELNTAEGLMRTFSQQLKSLSQAFGSLFLPALTAVMPYLQAFVELLTDAVRWIASLFGIEIQPVDWSGYNAGSSAVEELADSAIGAEDALGSAAKAAKELKNATIGIDELNVISPPSASGGSGSGGSDGSGGGSGFGDLDIDSLWDESIFDSIQSDVDAIKAKFEAWLPVLGTIAAALGGLTVASLIKNIGDALSEMNVLQKTAASIAILTVEAALVFTFADNYLESGNLLNLVGEALVTAAGGYLMFKAWGVGGAALSLGVSIAAQLLALEMSLADGTVSLSSPETWIQGITTILTGALGGLILSKHTSFFAKEGLVIGMAATASLVLTTMRMGAIESGEIDSGSLEAWLLELGSVLTAGLAGKFLGAAFYGARGGPAGAMIGVTAGLVLNLVTTIQAEGDDFGDSISDWINVGLTTAMAGFTAVKLWGIIGPTVTTALSGLIPTIGTAVTTALGGLGTAITAVGGGWVVAAVAAIVGAISLAIVDYDFTDIGRTIGEKIGAAVGAVGEFAVNVGTAIADGVTAAIDWVKETFDIHSVWDLIAVIFNPVSWGMKIGEKMIEIGSDVLPGLWKGIQDSWNNFWTNIGEFIDGFIQGFKDGLGIHSPSTVFAEIGGFVIDGLWLGISNMASWLWEQFGTWASTMLTKVKGFFGITSEGAARFYEIGLLLISGLWNGVQSVKTWLHDNLSGFVTTAITKVKEFFGIGSGGSSSKFLEIGGYLVQGIIDGITGMASTLWTSLKTWADGVIESVKEFFGIASPSKEFITLGGFLTDGLVEGMRDISALVEPLKAMWEKAKEWLGSNDFDFSFTPNIGDISKELAESWAAARAWWNEKKEGLSSYTPGIGSIAGKLSAAWASARQWWDSKKAGLRAYTPGIGSITQSLYDKWKGAKQWWDTKKAGLRTYSPPIASVYDTLSSRWKSARDWWNKKKGALGTVTPNIGSITEKLKNSWNAAKKWWSKNVKLSIPSLKFKVKYEKPEGKVARSVMKALDLPGWPKLSFAANGGMFDMGSLIWAGERGAEVVANAGGGKTGVMNVQQMQQAVYEGVYAAVMAANRAASGESTPAFNVYLDGRQITAVVERKQRERGAGIMGNQVHTYA